MYGQHFQRHVGFAWLALVLCAGPGSLQPARRRGRRVSRQCLKYKVLSDSYKTQKRQVSRKIYARESPKCFFRVQR